VRKPLMIAAFALMSLASPAPSWAQHAMEAPNPTAAIASTTLADAHELTQRDVDAWLDGFMPYALQQGDIAGAVVTVVRDGQVLTERGFGYADIAAHVPVDPEATLFRAGSISKLFTWISVMQLVEQGKIDLDADVNRYLDFRIKPFHDQPVTMRQLMTHTAGFEDAFKGGITEGENPPRPLGEVVRELQPARVFAPGSTPAYSNFGAALAGYIVERVSGTRFEDYVDQHVFLPLGMSHSTFHQPVPATLRASVARGYTTAHQAPGAFELISVPPAGSLSITGADAARFMIAILNGGQGLLQPASVALMQKPATEFAPGLNRMGLGFYQQRVDDIVAVGHAGDLVRFHSSLWLLPGHDVGVFISMNSAGSGEATSQLRRSLFEQFVDRYYPPANPTPPVELPTARAHARLLVGNYFTSRGTFTNFVDFGNLVGQTHVGLDDAGRPLVPDLFGGPSRSWIEVAPFLWQEVDGHGRLAAVVENGRVTRWSVDDVAPFMVWLPIPWYRDASWLLPAWVGALSIVAITALAWPARAILRRYYRAQLEGSPSRNAATRVTNALCCIVILATGGWIALLNALAGGLPDGVLWLTEIVGAVGFFGLAAAAAWKLVLDWTQPRGWGERTWSALLLLSAGVILYVGLIFHIVHFGVKY